MSADPGLTHLAADLPQRRGIVQSLFLAQIFSTLAMFGVIWFVQVVHYPLFSKVGEAGFRAYAASHANRTTVVVMPLMVAELLTAIALALAPLRPGVVSAMESWIGLALVGVIWASTGLLQVPLHDALQKGFAPELVTRLVATNWVRTAAWTLRAGLVVLWLRRSMFV